MTTVAQGLLSFQLPKYNNIPAPFNANKQQDSIALLERFVRFYPNLS